MARGRWRLVLADDHAVVRAGLRALITGSGACEVVGEAADPTQLREAVRRTRPDLVVLDLTLGAWNGLDLLPELTTEGPAPPRVVVLTMHDDPTMAREALRRGAAGYVLKEAAAGELTTAIEAVMAGRTYLQPELGARIARADAEAGTSRLGTRQREVLRLLALGHTNAEIAGTLFLSLRTVEAHRAELRSRLGARSRAELVDAARRMGLLG